MFCMPFHLGTSIKAMNAPRLPVTLAFKLFLIQPSRVSDFLIPFVTMFAFYWEAFKTQMSNCFPREMHDKNHTPNVKEVKVSSDCYQRHEGLAQCGVNRKKEFEY